ncbi:MAG: pyruvate kinase [Candidatus Geothermincolia bacterium]
MTDGGQPIRTRIVCTLGPSSHDAETLRKMAAAGMDVARLNSGHTDLDELLRYIDLIHEVGELAGKHIGIMLDLQGPRLRVGSIQGSSVELTSGQSFILSTEQKRGDENRVSVEYQGLSNDLKVGDRVFMDDGLIRMVVRSIEDNEITCDVVEGGVLLQGKGMNFPDSKLALSSFTERDRHYLEACLDAGIDWVAQSFVRTPGDVWEVIDAIDARGSSVPVMAKIEKPEGVTNIDSILEVAQGVMVARGDLGVEMPTEEVPLIQKSLIEKAMRAAIPVVTATQMLESMVEKPRPTRAEASDVANAILDGTDAVMLSAETSIGHYPVQAVETMARIAARAEQAIDYDHTLADRGTWTHKSPADAIGFAACRIASDLNAKAIITVTRSGYTARLVARYRPRAPIIAASPDASVIDSMSVLWGVRGIVVPLTENAGDMMNVAAGACAQAGLVKDGDLVVITGGFLDEESSKTNMVHVHTVKVS